MLSLKILLLAGIVTTSAYANSIQQLEAELHQENYKRASRTAIDLLKNNPDNVQIQFLSALAFQHNNELENAQHLYQEIIRDYPDLPEPRNNLAMIYLQQAEYDRAIELLTSSMQTSPAYATVWQNLNMLYQGLASEAYRKALNKKSRVGSAMDKLQLSALSSLSGTAPQKRAAAQSTITTAVPALTAAPALVPVPVTVTPPETGTSTPPDIQQLLIRTLQNWATAWERQNIDDYLDAYTADYKGNKADHNSWVEYRRSRILKPARIKVTISNIKVKSVTPGRAVIDFQQSFSSDNYRDKVTKRITLTKIRDEWKISREKTIAVL